MPNFLTSLTSLSASGECMRRFERGETILELLKEKGNASISYLAKTLNISESSVRRDIDYMTILPQYRNVHRVCGGIYIDAKKAEFEYIFELKVNLERALKEAIARKAVEYVEDGDTIFIDIRHYLPLFCPAARQQVAS